MVIRVVRMYFKEEHIEDFLKLFNDTKDQIREFDGCMRLELLQDHGQEHILTTYSYWRDLKALDNYRHSALFMEVWSQMKKYFAAKPIAFSCKKLMEVEGKEVYQEEKAEN
ncbi:antibiotic biosynthesis monooxygenase [Flammeovirgaceae bacterium 311]|nr:antibiotic biosynthesis monooxygenase [Flammeovirgaceae bacterium 311]